MNTLIDLCDHTHVPGILARLCARRTPFDLTSQQLAQSRAIWAQGRDAYLYYDGSIDDARTINRTHQLVSIATKGFPVIVPQHGLINLID